MISLVMNPQGAPPQQTQQQGAQPPQNPVLDFSSLITAPDVHISGDAQQFLSDAVHKLIYQLTKDVVNFTGPSAAFLPVTPETQVDESAAHRIVEGSLGVRLFKHNKNMDVSDVNDVPVMGLSEAWTENGVTALDRERMRKIRLKRGEATSQSKGSKLARQLAPRARCLDSLRPGSLLHEFIMAARDSSRPDAPMGASKPGRGRPPGGSRDDGLPKRRGRRRGRISNADKAAMAQGLL